MDKFKESKYWKELRSVGTSSEEKKGQGTICKLDENAYRVSFYLNEKPTPIGTYSSKELAEEARKYFISINYDLDKFKESKYWKELKNVGATSEEKKGRGSIEKTGKNSYCVAFNNNGNKKLNLGVFPSKELAEEARNYFISINYDFDKFKESKYWTKRTDRRQTSKNYWNHITMSRKNTSGITGVSLDRTKFSKGNACWTSGISINNKQIKTKFYSKEAAIQYRLELEKLGHEFNENHDQKRLEEQTKYIEEHARNMEEEKTAEKAAEAYRKGIENPDGEDTSTWDSKKKKKMKKLNVGDSISFKDGRKGIVEDYDKKYYYVKDNNANIVKITKIQDEESISWDEYYSELYEEWFGDIYDIFSRVNVITKLECYEEEGNPFNSAFIFVFNYNQNKNEQKVILRFELDTKKHYLKMQPEYILQTEEEKIHRKGKVTIINNVNDILDEMRPKILAYIKEFLLGIRFAFKQLNEEYEQSQNNNNIIM